MEQLKIPSLHTHYLALPKGKGYQLIFFLTWNDVVLVRKEK